MESEVISMTCSLLNAPENAAGSMTSGGTESIMCAMKAAKKYAKDTNKDLKKPNIVIPATAHPAFLKAAYYFEIEVRLVTCSGFDLVPDMADFRSKIDENTIMILGSSPAYPHGYIDPLKEISELALEKNVWMNWVDIKTLGEQKIGIYGIGRLNKVTNFIKYLRDYINIENIVVSQDNVWIEKCIIITL
jgi:glutamate/tyrosine decarboxylase-like PLP-dependent enzyme